MKISKIIDPTLPGNESDGTKILVCEMSPTSTGSPVRVDGQYLRQHRPEVGGYYVVYKDGYKSYSPAKAFEEGYTRLGRRPPLAASAYLSPRDNHPTESTLREHPLFLPILETTAAAFSLPDTEALLELGRREPLATARFTAVWAIRRYIPGFSLEEVALAFGRASQNWAILAINRTRERLDFDPPTRERIVLVDQAIARKRGPLFRAA